MNKVFSGDFLLIIITPEGLAIEGLPGLNEQEANIAYNIAEANINVSRVILYKKVRPDD